MKNFIWNSWNDSCCIVLSSLKIDQNSNLCFLGSSEDLNVPIDHEATSNTVETVNRVTKNLHNCYQNNEQLDTFTVDHLLSKFNVESAFIFSCLSPIDRIDLSYFAWYLNPALIEKKEFIVIPLCDGYHFQGYIVDVKKKQIVHIDSLTVENSANTTSRKIANIFFGNKDVKFKLLFSTRKQFDSNSCGMWLVSGICTFVLNLPDLNDRSSAFDVCCNLLDKATKLLINEKTCITSHFNFNEQANMFTTAQFLINILTSNPENS